MASSSNRKLNSSASKPSKPTYRRAGRAQTTSSLGSARRLSVSRSAASPKTKPKSKPASRKLTNAALKSKASARPKMAASNKAAVAIQQSGASQLKKASQHAAVGAKSVSKISQKAPGGAKKLNPLMRIMTQAFGVISIPFRAFGKLIKGALSGKIIALIVAAILVLAVAGLLIVNGPFFAATNIQFKGSAHVTAEAAQKAITVPDGTTLLNVNEDVIAEGLNSNPWVSGVSIEKEFPNTLIITPVERKVSAIVYISADDVAWAIGDDDTWIAPVSLSVTVDANGAIVDDAATVPASSAASKTNAEAGVDEAQDDTAETDSATTDDDAATDTSAAQTANTATDGSQTLTGSDAAQVLAHAYGAVLFTDVPADIDPVSGQAVDSNIVEAGLSYAKGFSAEFLQQIEYISLQSEDAITAYLTSGVEVALGAPDDIDAKEIVITRLLQQQQGVTYINVRTPDHYTFRSAPTV